MCVCVCVLFRGGMVVNYCISANSGNVTQAYCYISNFKRNICGVVYASFNFFSRNVMLSVAFLCRSLLCVGLQSGAKNYKGATILLVRNVTTQILTTF